MRRFLMSAALAATVLTAAPAMAQSWGSYPPPPPPSSGPGYPGGYHGGYNGGGYARVSPYQLRDMVERAIQRRDVSWQEGRDLRNQVNDLIRLDQRYRYGGYNGWEQGEIARRTDQVLQRLRYSRGNQGYDPRYDNGRGYNGRYDDGRGYDPRGDDGRSYDATHDRDDDWRYRDDR